MVSIHDDEPDTSEAIVRALLADQCPQWSAAPLGYLDTSGTDNAMWRVHLDRRPDLVVRLPRRPGSAAGVVSEVTALQTVERALRGVVRTPVVRHLGEPSEEFPHRWTVLEWIEGRDAWACRDGLDGGAGGALAEALGEAVLAIRSIDDTAPFPERSAGDRGGPLRPLLDRLDHWLDAAEWQAKELVDVDRVRHIAAESRSLDDPLMPSVVHGDLIPGNVLLDTDRLNAIIDWGGAGVGDPAQDLAPAWAIVEPEHRAAFFAAAEATADMIARARAIELEHAVGGVLYYEPRGHVLGDIMRRTLERILDDA